MANLMFLIAGAASAAASAFYYTRARKGAERLAGASKALGTIAGAKQTGWICAALRVSGGNALTAPYSGKHCIYYRALRQNFAYSKNGWRWSDVDEKKESVPFELTDATGKIVVDLKKSGITPDANQTFSEKENQLSQGLLGPAQAKFRKLEWAIASGETLTAFGKVKAGATSVEMDQQFEAALSRIKPEETILEEKSKAGSDNETARIFAATGALFIAYGLLI